MYRVEGGMTLSKLNSHDQIYQFTLISYGPFYMIYPYLYKMLWYFQQQNSLIIYKVIYTLTISFRSYFFVSWPEWSK